MEEGSLVALRAAGGWWEGSHAAPGAQVRPEHGQHRLSLNLPRDLRAGEGASTLPQTLPLQG